MILLQVNNLTKSFGAETILSNIKFEVQTRDRVALVGRNGAGKSTLLKIIAEQLSYDQGDILKPKDASIGYLAQNTGLESTQTIWNEMMSVFDQLKRLESQIRDLEQAMADPAVYSNEEHYHKIVISYDELQEKFKNAGGYQIEADIRSVLHGLQFADFDYATPISSLSGGQKTRLALGKLLLLKPDLLILDEPTNHLDIDTLAWLENYLQSYPGALLIVSHDRYFLDKVVNRVLELSQTSMRKYTGNYSRYLVQKAEEYERNKKLFDKQQDEVAKLRDFIQRNMARASTTKRAQSRQKTLEKVELLDRPSEDQKSAHFSFQVDRQSGNDVYSAHDLAVGYEDIAVSRNITFHLSRGNSMALVGPNGVGKSTLLKTVINKLTSLNGTQKLGTNVTIGYYDQEQAELTSNKRVLNELWDDYPSKPEKDIRTVLGNFLFSGDDVLKTVSSLSGGEKARLALCKLMLQNANFLLLDEPTNHLDLDSKMVLENALIDFPGTILFVSHDRYFINRIADTVLELSSEGATVYLGDYEYYLQKKQEEKEIELLEQQNIVQQSNPLEKSTYQMDKEQKKVARQKQRRLADIESLIESVEQSIVTFKEQLCDPVVFQDHEQSLTIHTRLTEAEQQLEALLEEWTTLQEEID